VVRALLSPPFLEEPASLLGIAVAHSVFNVLCTVLMLPLAGVLEKLVRALVPDAALPETPVKLDERLLTAPAVAMERCREVAADMAKTAAASLKQGIASLSGYTAELAASVREKEEKTDNYEAILGNYLVKLSARQISKADSREAAGLLKVIGDFERIADHAVNLLESSEEMKQKGIKFTTEAAAELHRITSAVEEILDLSLAAFSKNDANLAAKVEPLEQIIDEQKEQLRTWHIHRMQQGNCTMDAGYIWSDLLTNLERTADHCCNIAGCVLEGKE
jgi:phosphate:Na+ symporter